MCADCQRNISENKDLHCKSCTINGSGKCDEQECPGGTVYQNTTSMCEICQTSIGGLDCKSCMKAGAGRRFRMRKIYFSP